MLGTLRNNKKALFIHDSPEYKPEKNITKPDNDRPDEGEPMEETIHHRLRTVAYGCIWHFAGAA
jgi:hypothetical protein